MEQSIKLSIAGKEYNLKASGPEAERLMRIAAEKINAMLAQYDARFPDRHREDKLVFVTLQQTVGRLTAQAELERLKAEAAALEADMQGYLSDNGK